MVTMIPNRKNYNKTRVDQSAPVAGFDVTDNSFMDMLENSSSLKNKENQVINGVVININDRDVVVDVGMKTEGRVPVEEFFLGREADDSSGIGVKVGDIVKVFLEKIEGIDGFAVLSIEKALREERWNRFVQASETGEIITGVIFSKIKGGFLVDIEGVVAFLPSSQVDLRIVRDMSGLMNVKQQFKILKAVKNPYNFVVSRRAVMESSREKVRNELLDQIQEGDVVEGAIKNITDYGAFIDLGGIDGLLHVTDISWRRINHPSEVLTIGQVIKTKIIKFNKESKRISLGMKQIEANPWIGLSEKYPVGSRHDGYVVNLTDYGAFVELEDGIEGLVYVSEISWLRFNNNPRDLLNRGQQVQVEILGIDEEKNKISLSIKRCTENPWVQFAANYSCGDIASGSVRHITDFGIFVGFDNEEVDGLIHLCDITWSDDADKELFRYKKGDRLKVKILAIDSSKERISIGIKQLEDDPMEEALKVVNVGDAVECTVIGEKDSDLAVNISRGVDAIIERAEFSVNAASEEIKEGDGATGNAEEGTAEKIAVDFPESGARLNTKVLRVLPAQRMIVLTTK